MPRHVLPAVSLAIAAMCAPGSLHAEDHRIEAWIGRADQPLPSGYRHLAGTCLSDGNDVCDRTITIIRDEQSGMRTLLATRKLLALDGESIGDPRPYGLVTDAWEVDALDDASTEMTVGLCQRDGVEDARIVAIIRPDVETEWYQRFERLWRLQDDARLRAIPERGVRCLNEGYGYEG